MSLELLLVSGQPILGEEERGRVQQIGFGECPEGKKCVWGHCSLGWSQALDGDLENFEKDPPKHGGWGREALRLRTQERSCICSGQRSVLIFLLSTG